MRILVDGRLLEEGKGGIASYFAPFLKKLIEDFHEDQFVICGTGELEEFKARNVEFREMRTCNISGFKNPKMQRFYEAFYEFPAVLNAARGNMLISPYYDFVIPLRYRGRSILTLHDLCFWDLQNIYNLASRKFHQLVFNINKKALFKLVTVSNFSRRRIAEIFKIIDSELIYNSYEKKLIEFTDQDVESLKLMLKLESGKKYILYTSGLDVRKNIPMLLEAFERCSKKHPEARLICTGKEEHFKEYQCLINEFNLRDKLTFTGYVGDQELAILYQEIAHMVINLSIYEGFGRSNLEAMAYGVPLVCSDLDVFREVARDYPHYVKHDDLFNICRVLGEELAKDHYRKEPTEDERFNFEMNYEKWKRLVTDFKDSFCKSYEQKASGGKS